MTQFRSLLIVFVFSSLCLATVLVVKPFSTRGEPREALVAQSIYLSGNWLTPQGYGETIPSKPPLLHWAIVSVSKVLNQFNERTARLPSALASFSISICFFVFLLSRVRVEAAVGAVLMLLTTFEWYRAATTCRVDMLLAAFITLSLIGLYRYEEQKFRGYSIFALVGLVGATLTKGPVGLVLPFLVVLCFGYIRSYTWRDLLRVSLLIFVPALVLSGLWYGVSILSRGDGFWERFYYENVARFTSTMEDEPHAHSAPFLYVTLLLGLAPWSLFAVPLLISQLPKVPGALRHPILALRSISKFECFAVVVVGVFVLFFSIPSSKRGVYLLPSYPFICFLMAKFLLDAETKRAESLEFCLKVFVGFGLVLAAFLSVIIFSRVLELPKMIEVFGHIRDYEFYAHLASLSFKNSGFYIFALPIPLFLFCRLFLSLIMRAQVQQFLPSLAGCFLALLIVSDLTLVRRLGFMLSPKRFAFELLEEIPQQAKFYSFNSEFYGLSYYLSRTIKRSEEVVPESGSYVFLYDTDVAELKEKFPKLNFRFIRRSEPGIVKPGKSLLVMQASDS